MAEPTVDPEFEKLLEYLRINRGFDFTGYKRNTLTRRVKRRMEIVGYPNYADYLAFLEAHPREFTDLFNTILINVTDFFRDAEAWEYMAESVIPRLVSGKRREEQIRVWSSGCAGGARGVHYRHSAGGRTGRRDVPRTGQNLRNRCG